MCIRDRVFFDEAGCVERMNGEDAAVLRALASSNMLVAPHHRALPSLASAQRPLVLPCVLRLRDAACRAT